MYMQQIVPDSYDFSHLQVKSQWLDDRWIKHLASSSMRVFTIGHSLREDSWNSSKLLVFLLFSSLF